MRNLQLMKFVCRECVAYPPPPPNVFLLLDDHINHAVFDIVRRPLLYLELGGFENGY
jgi:hypothetical protein